MMSVVVVLNFVFVIRDHSGLALPLFKHPERGKNVYTCCVYVI